MRPVEFTPEAIIEAGQELQGAGRNITGFALRQKVGGGNPTRLKQVWDEHLASQSVQQAEPVAELPVEVAEEVAAVTKALTERLATLAVELNDKAVKAAERRVHEVVRSAGEQRAQAERELSDAAQTVDDLEAKLDEATGQELTTPNQKGVVAIEGPLPPGCIQTIWGDDARFVNTYWSLFSRQMPLRCSRRRRWQPISG